MMFTELTASGYGHSKDFYNAEFEHILSKVIACYDLMLNDKVNLSNDENSIRNVLLINYLKNNAVRRKIELVDYLFNREVPEDRTIGRTDIKIETLNTFQDTEAYYIIECKRLNVKNKDGKTGLNAKYISEGICRFASEQYSCYYKTNGIIGFVVDTIDIDKNINSLNTLLNTSFKQANTIQILSKRNIVSGFNFSYYSVHTCKKSELIIYHLMLDFSKNIQRNKA